MPMRLTGSSCLGLAAFLLAACGDDGGLIEFDVGVDIPRQTVPGFAEPPLTNCDAVSEQVIGEQGIAPFRASFDEEEELAGRDLGLLESASVDRVVLRTIDEAAGGDVDTFDFLDAIRIFVDDPGDGSPPTLVAELDPVPSGSRRIEIPGTGADILDIVEADDFVISGEVEGRPPCDNVHFVGEVIFDLGFL